MLKLKYTYELVCDGCRTETTELSTTVDYEGMLCENPWEADLPNGWKNQDSYKATLTLCPTCVHNRSLSK